jgi:3-oxoacyl-[acyl-carrier-protein] synthase III
MVPSDGKHGILSTHLYTDGATAEILYIPAGGSRMPATPETIRDHMHCVKMNGREVYRVAVRSLTDALGDALSANTLTAGDLQHVISHQANLRILEAVMKRFEIPMAKCWINLDKYGNTSSASLPMTLDEANRGNRLKAGDLIGMMAIGAGMAWGTAVVRW